jgi:hypothetical protein
MLPDSPRYYASVGRNEEARDLLTRIREHKATPEEIEREYLEIVAMAQDSRPSSPIQFVKILVGRGGRPGANLGRRAWLCVWLQIMASWTGITVCQPQSIRDCANNICCRPSRHTRPSFSVKLDTAI